ncbi:MAG: AAA family ATPase [Verrucomicrobiota bacterium]|nr:AAA family ATPase [Verrucomicrobiota bacterium]
MILNLSIQNLILVEKTSIQFGPRLNILTGETGAGKSAILSAIRLLLGERADTQLIREGTDLAVVEATLKTKEGTLLIRRELHRSGRSRCFIQDSQVSLQELRNTLSHSVELVDQSSAFHLSSPDTQRHLLDTYARANSTALEQSFAALTQAQAHLASLLQRKQTSPGEEKSLEEDLALIDEIHWQAGEDEQLAEEHNLLTHSHELIEKLGATMNFLTEMVPPLKRFANQLENAHLLDPHFQTLSTTLKTTSLELEDVCNSLLSYNDRINPDPERLALVEERIGKIEQLKRRFAPTHAQLQLVRQQLSDQLDQLAQLDSDIAHARKTLSVIEKEAQSLSTALSTLRHSSASLLANTALSELQTLNLPHARFQIELSPKPLSSTGVDQIRFLFSANPNQPLLPLDQASSGGELSRLLFAIKVALSEKEQTTCLIFDEIDSNVGGQTAALLAIKLQTLAGTRQLICVTHFVQVARVAHHHFQVTKETAVDGARTLIKLLDTAARKQEYARMTGETQ